eukprot:4073142-Lingulodinium_polyedra.AAC.1
MLYPHESDLEPARMPSRIRRFCSIFGVRATGGQTAIKWKRARACGHRLYEKDAGLISTICH